MPLTAHGIALTPLYAGKSTIGMALAKRLGYTFLEGDDYHPPSNVAKMQKGVPLVDDDRWPWLQVGLPWGFARVRGSAIFSCNLIPLARVRMKASALLSTPVNPPFDVVHSGHYFYLMRNPGGPF